MQPKLLKGNNHKDQRGTLTFNNYFDMAQIKRVYTIENESVDFIRAWQGHKIEQRWFSAIVGIFLIKTIEIDNWENPDKNLKASEFILNSEKFDILHIPKGFITSIQAMQPYSKLLIFSDFELNGTSDDYRFPLDYFSQEN